MGKQWVIIGTSCNKCIPCVIDVVDEAGKNEFVETLNGMNATLMTDINYDAVQQPIEIEDEEEDDYCEPFELDLELSRLIYNVPVEQYHEYVKNISYEGCTICTGTIIIVEKKNYSIKEILETLFIY